LYGQIEESNFAGVYSSVLFQIFEEIFLHQQYAQFNYFATLKETSINKHEGKSIEYITECEFEVIILMW